MPASQLEFPKAITASIQGFRSGVLATTATAPITPILTATPCPASYGYHYIRATMATTDDMATYSSCLLGHLRPQLWLTAVQQSPAFPLAATAPILAATPAQPPTLATSITSSVELVWLLPQLFLLSQLEVFSYCYC